MKIQQLSVFLENKPGRLSSVCNALAKADINLSTLSLADTHQYGILRLIVKDWQRAKKVLEDCGCAVTVTDVLATEVCDHPGGLARLLTLIENAGISVEYMYAFTVKSGENAVLVFRFDQLDKAITVLQDAGVNLISGAMLDN